MRILPLTLALVATRALAFSPQPHVLADHVARVEGQAERAAEARRSSRRWRAYHRQPVLERALALRVAQVGEWSLPVARVLRHLGENAWALGRRDQAHEYLGRSHEILVALSGSDAPETLEVASQRAESLRRRNYAGRAGYRLREAWVAAEERTGPYDPAKLPDYQARRAERLGTEYYREGRYAAAAPHFQRALANWEKSLGPGHPQVMKMRWRLAKCAQKQTAVPEHPRTNLEWMQKVTRLRNLTGGMAGVRPHGPDPRPEALVNRWDPARQAF